MSFKAMKAAYEDMGGWKFFVIAFAAAEIIIYLNLNPFM